MEKHIKTMYYMMFCIFIIHVATASGRFMNNVLLLNTGETNPIIVFVFAFLVAQVAYWAVKKMAGYNDGKN